MTPILAGLLILGALVSPAPAQQARFDDVVRNLRNPDPDERMHALKLLAEAKHLESIVPIAPLVNDPLDEIQLEAIATELAFYTVEDVKVRKRLAFIIETRSGGGRAEKVFNAGPLAVWPRAVPADLDAGLLRAIDDEHPQVRLEAIYAYGAIAQPPIGEAATGQLIKALDHYDPAIRAAAARVAGRLRVTGAGEALIRAVNDTQQPVRFAAMRALGDIREATAVQALTQQVEYYRKGEGAWSALNGLAKIGHPSSVAVFKARLADRDQFVRRAAVEGLARAGATSEIAALEAGAARDESAMVRVAMAFALQKLGRNYAARLMDALDSDEKIVAQVAEYALELGSDVAKELVVRLKDQDDAVRGNAALILGAVGTREHVGALQALAQDGEHTVRRAAERAIERIKLRGA